ncbi:MAG: nitroreductase [Rubritalea sp.]|jgi:nitroreductase|tara:strand:+ start:154 stop:792 length:639 start_codon:yes stop_codon:yes gene_type:complete
MMKMDVLERLKWRYATKVFDPEKKISAELWEQVEESLILTPSSFGLQPWKFLVITDQTMKEKLLEHSWNQAQVTDCSHLVVLTALKNLDEADVERFITDTHVKRGGELIALDPYKGMMNGFLAVMSEAQKHAWARNQVYIALGQLMTIAAMLEVDACPMEGITPAKYDELLGLEDGRYATVLACPMGYRGGDDKYETLAKVRYGKDDIIEHI